MKVKRLQTKETVCALGFQHKIGNTSSEGFEKNSFQFND
jgi:hypothetical protein